MYADYRYSRRNTVSDRRLHRRWRPPSRRKRDEPMTIRVAVCYGHPSDPAAFDEYYERVHIPLANAIPGLTEYTYSKAASLDGSPSPYYSVASRYFPDEATLKAGLASPEMTAAAGDVANFATGGATLFTHEESSVRS